MKKLRTIYTYSASLNAGRISWIILSMFLFALMTVQCKEQPQRTPYAYHFLPPDYDGISLSTTRDTIRFLLDENTYSQIKSFNIFTTGHGHSISFYDQRSQTINVYDFYTRRLLHKFSLKKFFPKEKLYKTKVHIRNYDSIFITNQTTLYLFDSAGILKQHIDFLDEPRNAWASFETNMPVVLDKNKIFAGVSPYVKETSLKALRTWKVLYEFDLQTGKPTLHYHLPSLYTENLYGYHFLDYNYCHNHKGHFIFSFPADTNIYETDLHNYHRAYYAKSKFQKGPINPVSKQALENDEGYKRYRLSDSYGPVVFDPYTKRYLRHAKQKISETDFENKRADRKESVIIFNDGFQIIGEAEKTGDYSFSSIFFGPDGKMYARINAEDEYSLQFVQLEYSGQEPAPVQLTSK